VDKREVAENNAFYCDRCDRGFKTEDKYKEHTAQHEKVCLSHGDMTCLVSVFLSLCVNSTKPGPLSSNNLEQVIYTHAAQANSAFHPSGLGK